MSSKCPAVAWEKYADDEVEGLTGPDLGPLGSYLAVNFVHAEHLIGSSSYFYRKGGIHL